MHISIHAPTRGATVCVFLSVTPSTISIHAPTRGATHLCVMIDLSNRFQSTLPREERRSIRSLISFGIDFNPRSHERSDGGRIMSKYEYLDFNPRSHERSDDHARIEKRVDGYFNPRSHERSDSNIAQKICLFLYNTDNKYIIR